MKILMISNHLGVQSGVQRYVQNLLLHLDTAKYRVTLFVGQCPPRWLLIIKIFMVVSGNNKR